MTYFMLDITIQCCISSVISVLGSLPCLTGVQDRLTLYCQSVCPHPIGVVPPYNDEKTCSFVRSQKEQQFQDLKHALQVMGRLGHPSNLLPMPHCSSPDDFVLIYLLEKDRLLSPAVNQLRLEHQVDLSAIAQAFLTFFDEGEKEEVETYWLFSKFAQKWESQQQHVSSLVSVTNSTIVSLLLCHDIIRNYWNSSPMNWSASFSSSTSGTCSCMCVPYQGPPTSMVYGHTCAATKCAAVNYRKMLTGCMCFT